MTKISFKEFLEIFVTSMNCKPFSHVETKLNSGSNLETLDLSCTKLEKGRREKKKKSVSWNSRDYAFKNTALTM